MEQDFTVTGTNRWRIDADYEFFHEAIAKYLESPPKNIVCDSCADCWRQFGVHTKWNPDTLMIALSEKFSNVVFSLEMFGDAGKEKWFYLSGLSVNETYLALPQFPSKEKIRRGLTVQADTQARSEREELKAKRKEIEQAQKDKKARLAALAKDLNKEEDK